jgi:HK97 family phage portal protein
VSLVRRARERRAAQPFVLPTGGNPGWYATTDGSIPTNGSLLTNHSGVPVTEHNSLQQSTFYACTRLLADSIGILPWDNFRTIDGFPRIVAPQSPLLADPDPLFSTSQFDFKHMLVTSLAVRGNFFGLVTSRDRLEYPQSLLPLHPDWVRLDRDPNTWRLRTWVMGEQVDNADIFHIPYMRMPGYDYGLSPVTVFAESIGLALAAEQYGAKWFRDGASPSSVLETDLPQDDDQVKRVQRNWVSSHGGRRLPAVLSGGFKWKPITITPEESQFLETRQFQVAEIARMFGVPPHMVGDVERSTSWGTGIEQQNIGFVTHTLLPWLTRIESAFNRITPRGQHMKFNVNALLRGDLKSRYESYQLAIDSGFMNPDEARGLEEMPPIPGGLGQKFRQPLNMAPLGYEPPDPAPAPKTTPSSGATAPTPSSDNSGD